MSVDKDSILNKFYKNFSHTNTVTIDDLGYITVKGDCVFAENATSDGKLPVKFKQIYGDFYCSATNLTSLEGSPRIVRGLFDCSYNKLDSLEGGPTYVHGIYCNNNKLTSLKGSPWSARHAFNCSNNKLTSLEYISKHVETITCHNNRIKSLKDLSGLPFTNINCSNNKISSFDGLPEHIKGDLVFTHNKITSFDGCPKKVGYKFDCSYNKISSFENIPKKVGTFIYNTNLFDEQLSIVAMSKAKYYYFNNKYDIFIRSELDKELKTWMKKRNYRFTGKPLPKERIAEFLLSRE